MKRKYDGSGKGGAQKRRVVARMGQPQMLRPWRPAGMIPYQRPRAISNINKAELKGVDLQTNLVAGNVLATTNTNGAIALLNAVQPGTGSWNRIGKRIRMKSIRYRMILQSNANGVAELINNTIRVTLVYDRQPSGNAIPAFDTIFGSTDQTGAEACNSFLDSQRYDNTGRFTILKDDVIDSDMAEVVGGGAVEWQKTLDCYVKLKGLETIFSGQSNPCTIADISTGALYLVFRGEVNNGFTRWSVANTQVRLRYFD